MNSARRQLAQRIRGPTAGLALEAWRAEYLAGLGEEPDDSRLVFIGVDQSGGILFFIIWIAIAFWPARVAARKGHSFFLFFLFSLFFPLALLVAYLVGDRRRYAY